MAAAIALRNTGSIIGPYFLGRSIEAIEVKFSDKISNPNFELKEISIGRVQKLKGYAAALERVRNGEISACIITE